MTDHYVLFLSNIQAAELIIHAAAQTRGKSMDAFCLAPAKTTKDFNSAEDNQRVQLCFIHETGNRENRKERTLLLEVVSAWANDQGHQFVIQKGYPAEVDFPWKVKNFFLKLLFDSGQPAVNARISDQLLAYLPLESNEQLTAAVTHLAASATYTRVAVADDESGDRLALFYLKDDTARGSSLQSVFDAGYFPCLERLEEYSDGESSIFLPTGLRLHERLLQPSSLGLALFCRLLREAPLLWGGEPKGNAPHNLLAVILPHDTGNKDASLSWRLFDVRSLTFVDQAQLVFRADDFLKVEVVSLSDSYSASGEDLRKAIQQADPLVGYSLSLRDTGLRLTPVEMPDEARIDQEISSMVEQINNLQYRLALRQQVSFRKPILLRFTHKQLPALADYLRSLSPKRLAEGALLYAYQSTGGAYPKGYHYLFLPPEILAEADIIPLFAWPNLEEKRVFWLDPFWARYYPNSIERCYVFVPEHQALFPSMHNWDEQDMDEYLRAVMQDWASQEQGKVVIPQNPLYIFDTILDHVVKGELFQEINVYVIDMNAFKSIKINLPWINDNLILNEELSNSDTIRDLADTKTQIILLNGQLQKEKYLQLQLSKSAEKIQEQLHSLITSLADSMSGHLNRINSAMVETSENARLLNTHLQAIQSEYQVLSSIIEKMKGTQGQVKTEAQNRLGEAAEIQQKVEQAVKEADRVQRDMDTSTIEMIRKLE